MDNDVVNDVSYAEAVSCGERFLGNPRICGLNPSPLILGDYHFTRCTLPTRITLVEVTFHFFGRESIEEIVDVGVALIDDFVN